MNLQALLDNLRSLAPVDLFGLGLTIVLVFLGIWRGLWWQVIRLLGLVLAVVVARVFSPEASAWLSETIPEIQPRMAHGTAWVGVFLLTLGAATLLGILGQKMLEAMQLGLVNRLGGAFVGALTGVLVHLAVLVILCQLAPETFVARHVSGTYSEQLVEVAGQRWRVVLGAEAADEVERVFRQATERARQLGAGEEAAPTVAPAAQAPTEAGGVR